MSDTAPKASIKDIRDNLKIEGETLKDFAATWKDLSDKDKDDVRKGIADGSMTY